MFPLPLRYSLTFMLVLLCAILNVLSFRYELTHSYQRHEDYSKQEAIAAGSTYSALLQHFYLNGHPETARILIEKIKGDQDLKLALTVDDRNKILHATSLDTAREQLPRLIPQLDGVRAVNASKLEFTRDHRSLKLFYPLSLELTQGAAAPRTGILHLEYDLTGIKKKAYTDALDRIQGVLLVWGSGILILWVYFQYAVTARVQKLLSAVRFFAQGGQGFNSGLGGSDEFMEISDALERGVAKRDRLIAQANERLKSEIEERKQIEAELRESEERFRTLTALSPVGIYATDAEGGCTYVNNCWCEMTGLTPEKARGDGWIAALHPEDRGQIADAWQGMVRSGRGSWGMHYRFITPEGKTTWVYGTAAPLCDINGRVTGYIGTNTDITPMKEALVAIETEQQRLFSLLDELPVFIYLRTADYKIRFANKIFRQTFGDPASAYCYELVYREPVPCKDCRQIMSPSDREATQREVIAFNKHTYQLYEYPFTDSDGLQLMLHMGFDITGRKKSEEALRESEKKLRFLSSQLLILQEKERKHLAAELHDSISQTLSAAKFGLERMILQNSGDMRGACSQTVAASIQMLKQAIDEVRKISTDLRPSLIDDLGIVAAIGWFCREFQVLYAPVVIEQNLTVQEDAIPAGLKIILFRVLQEAANNAARHSSAGRISVSLKKTTGTLVLEIRDNGSGFAVEKLGGKDFRPGGLGLISMKERVELSGGTFSIESSAGSGTAVIACWPETPTG
jgi:PAS domain S-box-containing protein